MAHVILMPKAGQSMTEGKVVSWLKNEGDRVTRGDPLFEIETDKANLEVEALASGILRKILAPAGETRAVLTAVGVIGDPDEAIDFDAIEKSAREAAEASSAPLAPQATENGGGPQARTATPRERRVEAERARPRREPKTSAPGTTVLTSGPSSVPAPPRDARGERLRVSPLARRLAAERNVDLRAVRGTGPGGRVLRRDVEAAPSRTNGDGTRVGLPLAPSRAGSARMEPAPPPPAEVPFAGMRKAIAQALRQSKSTIPHFYTTAVTDVTDALGLKRERAQAGEKLTVNDIILRAVTLALLDEPRMNCRVFEDRIEYPESINLGLAVGSDDGLVVPVLLRAEEHDLASLAQEARQVIASAQAGRLVGSGQGTFTISNLGMYGVESFSAIINPPEGAILAVGAARDELVPWTGGFLVRSILRVTLSCDHRAIDGLIAARFLARLRWFLENPSEL